MLQATKSSDTQNFALSYTGHPSTINIMLDVENVLNDDEFFADNVDTLKEGIEQHRKRESLKDAISDGKVYLQGGKNNEHVKGLIKPAMQLSKKYMLNIQS